VSPLADVIDEINDDDPDSEYTIIIINCNSGIVDYEDYTKVNIAGIAMRSLQDIAITEIFNNDVSEFLRINDIINQVRSVHPALDIHNYNLAEGRTRKILRAFKAIVIQTDPGVLGDALVSNPELNARRMRHGEEKAAEALEMYQRSGMDPALVIV
jgi:NTE family protein